MTSRRGPVRRAWAAARRAWAAVRAAGERLGRGTDRARSRALVAVGVAGIVVVLAGLLVAVALPRGWYLLRTGPYTAQLADAAGLEAGDPVLVAGVPTGKVESVEFAGDHVDAHFRLDDDRPLGGRTTAAVRLQTILGRRYLEVRPAGHGEVGPGRTIPLARTTVPYSLDDAATAATATAQGLDPDALEQMVRALGDAVPHDPDALRRAVTGVGAAARAMSDDGAQLDRLLTSARSVAGLVARQDASLDALTSDARTVLGSLADRRAALGSLAADLRTILGSADRILASADASGEGGEGGLGELAANLRSVLGTLERNGDAIDTVLEQLPSGVRAVVDASGNGPWVDVSAAAGPIPDTLLCVLGLAKDCR